MNELPPNIPSSIEKVTFCRFSAFRRETLATPWQGDLYRYIGGIISERDGISLEFGGVTDHMHILAKLMESAIVDVLRDIKALSSKWINDLDLVSGRVE